MKENGFHAKILRALERVTSALGSLPAIACAIIIVVTWFAGGFLQGFTPEYQIPINTLTTIVTFCMVFIIQNSQNRDSKAMEAKLDELIRSISEASDEYRGIEKLSEKEIKELHDDE